MSSFSATLWAALVGMMTGLAKVFSKALELWKTEEMIQQGKSLQQAEIAKEEVAINRETSEIIAADVPEEETIRKLENGSF
jgi:hypothetical protein